MEGDLKILNATICQICLDIKFELRRPNQIICRPQTEIFCIVKISKYRAKVGSASKNCKVEWKTLTLI